VAPLPFHVYLHFPWCTSRCPYCAFTSIASRFAPAGAWVEAVGARWRVTAPFYADRVCQSVYFGGGSPSLLEPQQVAAVLASLPHLEGAEVTLETNPGPITRDRFRGWRAAGVTRVSVGVQSFDPAHARLLGRARVAAEARPTLKAALDEGFASVSADLIFGLPGQGPEQVQDDVGQATMLGIHHVSLYGLSIEAGTPFERAVARGLFAPVDADTWRCCYDAARQALKRAGFEQYEVSNFARPGHRCRHNEGVWKGEPYAGIGPSAHGLRPGGERTQEVADVDAWLGLGQPPAVERPDPRQAAIDLLLTRIRHVEGIDLAELSAQGFALDPRTLAALIGARLVDREGPAVRLTPSGFPLADGITARLCDGMRRL
jgi:putative oxygen-independent coproporphyrinogen III oxidase